jgi:hypothetical protein
MAQAGVTRLRCRIALSRGPGRLVSDLGIRSASDRDFHLVAFALLQILGQWRLLAFGGRCQQGLLLLWGSLERGKAAPGCHRPLVLRGLEQLRA